MFVLEGLFLFKLVVSNILNMFTPKIGEMIQFDDHIFQMGLKPPTMFFSIEIFVMDMFNIKVGRKELMFVQ